MLQGIKLKFYAAKLRNISGWIESSGHSTEASDRLTETSGNYIEARNIQIEAPSRENETNGHLIKALGH